jgi:putative MATE family efflux protein
VDTLAPPPTAPAATPGQIAVLKRRVWHIALPAIGENVLHTSLMMVDTFMIGRYGPIALAAAAISGVIVWRAQMTFACLDRGSMAMVARAHGARDPEKASRAVAQAIVLGVIIGLFVALFGVMFAPQLLYAMKAEPDVVRAGTPYLQILAVATLPRIVFAVVAASLRATGDTRFPMWVSLYMNILNICFNIPLIFGIPAIAALGFSGWGGLGLTGSGISTAISILFAAVMVSWKAFSGRGAFHMRREHFRIDLTTIRTLVRISIPSFAEEALLSIGFLIFFRFIAVLGTNALAAHSISTRIEALSFMAGLGFTVAAAALVGQSLGQKNIDLARHAFKISTKYCVAMMSVIAIGLIYFAEPIVRAFAPGQPDITEMAAVLLVIAAIEQPLLGIGMTITGGLRGAGDTLTPMFSSIICGIGIRVGAAYLLAFPMGYGIYGIYMGTIIDWLVRAMFLYWFFRLERWAHIKL